MLFHCPPVHCPPVVVVHTGVVLVPVHMYYTLQYWATDRRVQLESTDYGRVRTWDYGIFYISLTGVSKIQTTRFAFSY